MEINILGYKKPPVSISLRNLQEVVPILKIYCISDTILVQSLVGCVLGNRLTFDQKLTRLPTFFYLINSMMAFLIASDLDKPFF